MRTLSVVLILLLPLLIAIYTFNYGRWAWRQRLWAGAVGVFLLAALTLAVPALVLMYNE